MTEPIHKGKDLPPVWVIHAASGGDSEAMEQVLRYYDDLPVSEIAHHLKLATGTVKRYLHDGATQLRELLGTEDPPADTDTITVTTIDVTPHHGRR